MKRLALIILLLICIQNPGYSINKKMVPETGLQNPLPNIFIYSIPDDDTTEQKTDTKTEDVQYIEDINSKEENEEEVITLIPEDIDDNATIGATVLKGYAQYIEDTNAIYLKDEDNNFVLNLKQPQKISETKGLDLTSQIKTVKTSSKYKGNEYFIEPNNIRSSESKGNFTFGALYNNEIDNIAMLESEAGLFTKYEKNNFALSSSVKKSLNTTYAQDYNTISIAPELKLNSYLSLKNTLSADVTRNRRSAELVFSLNPFGKKDKDRMLLEAGAKQTYYVETGNNATQFNFSAKFKL